MSDPHSPQRETLLINATQRAAAASLAGGIIAASGRPHSLKEALEVLSDVHNAMFSAPGNGHYERWKADEGRFDKIYS
jgi:hypothetical protein